jgi:hypothetical protein
MAVIVKCDWQEVGSGILSVDGMWIYEGFLLQKDDEAFIWFTKKREQGLAVRGSLVHAGPPVVDSRGRARADLKIRISERSPRRRLTIANLTEQSPVPAIPKLWRKLLKCSHTKVALLEDDEVLYLRSCFDIGAAVQEEMTERKKRLAEQATRPDQATFSDAVRQNYGNVCAVTGCTTRAALDAAHIRVEDGKDDNSSENGILLRKDVHALFDAHLVTLTEDASRVETSLKLTDHPGYSFLRSASVASPACGPRPSIENIRHHRARFTQKAL